MAIKIKAVERKLKFTKDGEGEYRYVMLNGVRGKCGKNTCNGICIDRKFLK